MIFRGTGAVVAVIVVLGTCQPVAARPEYLVKFQADPFRRPEIDGCVTCHVNPAGGGARNDFGAAFQASSHEITPLLRAGFPQQFKFETAKLPDGSAFLMSDPQSKFVVFQRGDQRVSINLAEVTAPKTTPVPPPENRMSFFVTSAGLELGGKLGGLAGADRFCQDLAKAAGAGDRTWRAYLSTSFQGMPAVNAGDRIGSGAWYNAKGVLFARGPIDLHASGRVRPGVVLTEKGETLSTGGDDRLDVLTGTLPNGTAAVGQNCDNWTGGEGQAMAADPANSWNSGRLISCSSDSSEKRPPARLYCFAAK